MPKNSAAIPAAMTQTGSFAGCVPSSGMLFFEKLGRDRLSASFAGQTATHSRHPVHSADLMVTNLSTGSAEGQALKHFAQSMQVSGLRRMRAGLRSDVIPSSAP